MIKGGKAAIIGFGGMGQRHYHACKKAGVEISAICEFEKEKIQAVLPDFPYDHIYSNFAELIKNETADIINVATNTPTHAEIVIQASEAGVKNILCEKPMATNVVDAKRMVAVCKKNHTRLAVNHISRWSQNQRKMKEIIKTENAIGKLRHIYFHCGSVGLGNQGTHAFDKMRYFFDSEPEWVIGVIDKTGTPNVRGSQFRDPGGFGMILFQNGARGFIDTSEDTGVPYILELVGEYGKAVINEYHDYWELFSRSHEDKKYQLTRYIMPLNKLTFEPIRKFDIIELTSYAISELLSGSPISCTGEDGMKNLEMAIAFHISDRENNRKVYLPLDDKKTLKVNFA